MLPGSGSENGYPGLPTFNFNGYFIYDGLPRIFNDRFVNFNKVITPFLTESDKTYLAGFAWPNTYQPTYEGDAALGWFKSNQSAYPVTMATERLHFTNVDYRHQIFTDKVNLGEFADGDKNTVIIDRDGSLSNFATVTNGTNQTGPDTFPISLNNLPFNATLNSIDIIPAYIPTIVGTWIRTEEMTIRYGSRKYSTATAIPSPCRKPSTQRRRN
jgi:hypothetical protein